MIGHVCLLLLLLLLDSSERLRSLMLRLDVLESECDNINELMRVIALDIRSEENQVTQQ